MSFVTKNKITAQCLYYLATSIGYDKLSVNIQPNRNGDYYWISSCKRWGKSPNVLKKMVYLRNSEEEYVYDLETEHGIFACGVGKIEILNTDSVFMSFNLEDLSGEKIIGKKALEITIDLAIEAGKLASKFLKEPHDLEYEKTFMPFLLLSKKRYVGMLYEKNPNKCKMKSMGIVLKRRDNAACVKDCYGRVVDLLMKGESADIASNFVRSYIKDMVDEKIGTDKLIISKSLNGFYKNPDSIAHKVLADRMAKRDPGNKPSVGSRIPFIYIETKVKCALQGDRIETPLYIKENNLKPDYAHYITNQIMKPVTQIFNLLLEQMSKFNKKTTKALYDKDLRIVNSKYSNDESKLIEKKAKLRDKMVKKIIFEEALRKYENSKNCQPSISSFFGKK
jgi:DNA polymerase elongation subunit (family B)